MKTKMGLKVLTLAVILCFVGGQIAWAAVKPSNQKASSAPKNAGGVQTTGTALKPSNSGPLPGGAWHVDDPNAPFPVPPKGKNEIEVPKFGKPPAGYVWEVVAVLCMAGGPEVLVSKFGARLVWQYVIEKELAAGAMKIVERWGVFEWRAYEAGKIVVKRKDVLMNSQKWQLVKKPSWWQRMKHAFSKPKYDDKYTPPVKKPTGPPKPKGPIHVPDKYRPKGK